MRCFFLLPSWEKVGRVSGSDEGDALNPLHLSRLSFGSLPLIRHAAHDTFSHKGRRTACGQ
ncbi:MAG TPA: hypothetical protein DEB60_11180 [Brevundimonas sp.]|nr:hypothetical protein [Brevundimonas sp.]